MGLGIFKRHQEQVRASMLSGSTAFGGLPADSPAAAAYAAKLAELGMDEERLRNIQSVEAKIAAKREMIEAYIPHVKGWIEGVDGGGTAFHDEIVVTMMLWLIDLGAFNGALELAERILAHDLPMPERYRRTTGCVVAEEIANRALVALGTGGAGTFDRAVLEWTEGLTHEKDMPDQVRAKLKKALGMARMMDVDAIADGDDGMAGMKSAQLHASRDDFVRALELDPSSGVKQLIKQLDARISKLPETITAQSGQDGDGN